jgi:hypothetical protein
MSEVSVIKEEFNEAAQNLWSIARLEEEPRLAVSDSARVS